MARYKSLVIVLLLTGCAAGLWARQPSASAAAAKELSTLLDQRKLDSFAVKMPDSTDQFVAALYFPQTQLLVVSARYAAPAQLNETILKHKYRDAYTTLSSAGERAGKLFVQDLDADGLPPAGKKEQQVDVIYEDVTRQTIFNGNWRGQKLSEAEYNARREAADQRYAGMLKALVAGLKATP